MTEWEKAEAGLLYDAKYDPDLDRGRKASQELSFDYNALRPSQIKEREEMVRKHFKKTGKKFLIEQPFRCDFWERVSVGENFYSNYNFVVLVGHPFDVELRNSGIEYAWPIRIGNNVWIGGGTKIIGGVSIGDDVIIAAGSVVIRDIPSGVLAGGNPCKVIRKLTPEDDEKYKKGFQGFSEG